MPVETTTLHPAIAARSLRTEPQARSLSTAATTPPTKTQIARTDSFAPAKPNEITAGYDNPALTRKIYANTAQGLHPQSAHTTVSSAIRDNAAPQAQTLNAEKPVFGQADLDALLQAWGTVSGQERFASEYDLDGDGSIGANDLAQLLGNFSAEAPFAEPVEDAPPTAADVNNLLAAWGTSAGEERFNARFDLNGDGRVGAHDLAELLGRPPAETATDALPTRQERLSNLLEAFGSRLGDQQFNSAFDFDGDGVINAADLADFLGRPDEDE